jgi:hypothetical protein
MDWVRSRRGLKKTARYCSFWYGWSLNARANLRYFSGTSFISFILLVRKQTAVSFGFPRSSVRWPYIVSTFKTSSNLSSQVMLLRIWHYSRKKLRSAPCCCTRSITFIDRHKLRAPLHYTDPKLPAPMRLLGQNSFVAFCTSSKNETCQYWYTWEGRVWGP